MVLSQSTPPPNPVSSLTDAVLIQTFVEGFVQGRPLLLSNQTLRTEPLFDSMQLIANKEGLISTAKMVKPPITAVVRQTSSYWEVLHEAMTAQGFFPVTQAEQEHCYTYRYCEPPKGYEIQCTAARELWRVCWGRGYGRRSGIPLDLLLWARTPMSPKQGWQSVRGMDCDQGQLMIKMLGGSIKLDGTSLVVWSRQRPNGRFGKTTQDQRRHRPSVRGYLRLNS